MLVMAPIVNRPTTLMERRGVLDESECCQERLRCTQRTHRLLMPDGSIKYVHVLSHAARDLEVIGAVTDITERS